MSLKRDAFTLTWPRCPRCQREMGIGEDATLRFGGVAFWSGCQGCLKKLIERGIAAVDKVEALEARLAILEAKASSD